MEQSENRTFRFACLNKPGMGLFRPSLGSRRGVAQPGSALASGARGRRFKSSHPDQLAALRFLLRWQDWGMPSVAYPFGGANVRWTFAIFPPHPCRGDSDSRPGASRAPGVRPTKMFAGHFCLSASPSHPDHHTKGRVARYKVRGKTSNLRFSLSLPLVPRPLYLAPRTSHLTYGTADTYHYYPARIVAGRAFRPPRAGTTSSVFRAVDRQPGTHGGLRRLRNAYPRIRGDTRRWQGLLLRTAPQDRRWLAGFDSPHPVARPSGAR